MLGTIFSCVGNFAKFLSKLNGKIDIRGIRVFYYAKVLDRDSKKGIYMNTE